MTMVKNAGHCASSTQSKGSENNFINILKEEVAQLGPNFGLLKRATTEQIYGKTTISRKLSGKPSYITPDGGFITYKGKIVGAAENKYQHSRLNACERAFRYIPIAAACGFDVSNVLLNLEGEGFTFDGTNGSTQTMSLSTGGFVQGCITIGYTFFLNESPDPLRVKLREKLNKIKAQCEYNAGQLI